MDIDKIREGLKALPFDIPLDESEAIAILKYLADNNFAVVEDKYKGTEFEKGHYLNITRLKEIL